MKISVSFLVLVLALAPSLAMAATKEPAWDPCLPRKKTVVKRKPSSPWPAPITAKINALRTQCKKLGGRPASGHEAVKRADLNGDRILDYVFYAGDFHCAGAETIFGPPTAAGQEAALYLGTKKGSVRKVWSSPRIRSVTLVDRVAHPALLVTAVREECGYTPTFPKTSHQECVRWVKNDPWAKKKWFLAVPDRSDTPYKPPAP